MNKIDKAKKYVGGNWDKAGLLQINFLKEEGLKPEHKLLEIGCGCFRAGRHMIDYLDVGNYFGVEKNNWLVEVGMFDILGNLEKVKKPKILVDSVFGFNKFRVKFDFAIAKSLFTHLVIPEIEMCLENLYEVLKPKGVFYASFFIGDSSENIKYSHDNKKFKYSMDEIKAFSKGWNVELLGNKGSIRQKMVKFTKL